MRKPARFRKTAIPGAGLLAVAATEASASRARPSRPSRAGSGAGQGRAGRLSVVHERNPSGCGVLSKPATGVSATRQARLRP